MTNSEQLLKAMRAYINNDFNKRHFPRCVAARQREYIELRKRVYPNETRDN